MTVLVLGATGLLGNTLFRVLHEKPNGLVYGTIRDINARNFFIEKLNKYLIVLYSIL